MLAKTQDDAQHDMVEIIKALTILELPYPLAVFNDVCQTPLLALMSKRLADEFASLFNINVFELPTPIPPLRSYLIWSKSREEDLGHQWFGQIQSEVRQPLIHRKLSD